MRRHNNISRDLDPCKLPHQKKLTPSQGFEPWTPTPPISKLDKVRYIGPSILSISTKVTAIWSVPFLAVCNRVYPGSKEQNVSECTLMVWFSCLYWIYILLPGLVYKSTGIAIWLDMNTLESSSSNSRWHSHRSVRRWVAVGSMSHLCFCHNMSCVWYSSLYHILSLLWDYFCLIFLEEKYI